MKVKKWLGAVGFCTISLVITFLLYKQTQVLAGERAITIFAEALTTGDQLIQIVLSVLIYLYGYLVMKTLDLGRSEWWEAVLAFPMGILCWCVLSSVVTILGIPYRLGTMIILLLLLLALCIVLMKRNGRMPQIATTIQNLLYALGAAGIASSGIFIVYMSNDSLYYLVKYGEILSIDGGFSENVSYWLTWIGITPAFISSLASFFGLYSIYTIHHMMTISFVLFFMVTVYEQWIKVFSKKSTVVGVIIMAVALILTPAFFLLGQWVISNTYFMIYMYIFICAAYELHKKRMNAKGTYIFLSILLVFLTLSRSESVVTVCFLLLCASTLALEKKGLLLYLLMPSAVMQVAYWIKICLVQGFLFDGMITKLSFPVMVLALVGTGVYLLLIRDWLTLQCRDKVPQVIIGVLLLLNAVVFVLIQETSFASLDALLYNWANEQWGFFPWTVLFIYMVFIRYSAKLSYWDLNWLGFILLNFGICVGRGGAARYGIGDSLNRIMCSIVPVIWFAIVMHIRNYLSEKGMNKGAVR